MMERSIGFGQIFSTSFSSSNAAISYYPAADNVNQESIYGTTPARFSGIYKYDMTATTNPIVGELVEGIQAGTSNSVDLSLTSNRSILISNPARQGFFAECCPNPSFGSKDLGIIYFPDNYSTPGFTWHGPSLVTDETQPIRSRTGLPNFSDAIKSSYATLDNGFNLGTNPGSCCEEGPRYVNVECMQNNNSTGGNEAYFTFTLQRACTNYVSFSPPTCATNAWEFTRPLRVEVEGPNFETPVLKYFQTNVTPNGWTSVPGATFNSGEANVSAGILNGLNDTEESVQFRLTVDAQSSTATGNFKVKVNYRDYGQNANNGTSCCRMAVDGEDNAANPEPELLSDTDAWKLYPNPATNSLTLKTSSKWESYRVVDMQGRIIAEGGAFSNELQLNTSLLSNGLYRILVIGKQQAKSVGFQILK